MCLAEVLEVIVGEMNDLAVLLSPDLVVDEVASLTVESPNTIKYLDCRLRVHHNTPAKKVRLRLGARALTAPLP